MKHMQKSDSKLEVLRLSDGYQRRMFVDFLTQYTSPLNCVSLLSVEYFSLFEDVVQNMCFCDVCS